MDCSDQNEPCYLLVPGWRNSGPEHWQTLWQRELPSCFRVEQDDWDNPDPVEWTDRLDRTIAALDAPVVLVAHSLGCHTVARWAVRNNGSKIFAALLVAPPAAESRSECQHIVRRFVDGGAALPFASLVVGSETDPHASLAMARGFAARWGSRFANAGRVGHINVDSGHGPWPEGKDLLWDVIQSSGRFERQRPCFAKS